MRSERSTPGHHSASTPPPLGNPRPIGILITWHDAGDSEVMVIGHHRIGPLPKPCRADPDKNFWHTPEVPTVVEVLARIISESRAGRRGT